MLEAEIKSVDNRNRIFTKLGDNGRSKIYTGDIDKDHIIVEAVGTTEELNAFIGLAKEYISGDEKLNPVAEKLQKIQLVLVDVIEILSSLEKLDGGVHRLKPPNPPTVAKVTQTDVNDLESLINHYGTILPPAEKVIIPGSGKASAVLHVSRAVCRRCERILVRIFKDMEYEKNIIPYINRLSSYLTQAARICAKFANKTEYIYSPQYKENEKDSPTV